MILSLFALLAALRGFAGEGSRRRLLQRYDQLQACRRCGGEGGKLAAAQARQRAIQQPPERNDGDCTHPRTRVRQQSGFLAERAAAQ